MNHLPGRPAAKLRDRFQTELRQHAAGGGGGRSPQRAALRLLAGFFLLMLLFTLLSRAADGMTIAQVQTAKPGSGILTHRVEASGRVEAAGEQSLAVPQGAPVESLPVKAGDQVRSGAVLATFRKEELDLLLEKRKNELAALRVEFSAARSDGSDLEQAQQLLWRLRSDLESNQTLAQETIDRAQAALEEAHRSYERLYEEHEGYLDESYKSYRNTVNDADNELLAPGRDDSEREQAWIAGAKAARAEMESARETIRSREDALQEAIRQKEKARVEAGRAIADQEQAVAQAERSGREKGDQATVKRGELSLSIREKEREIRELAALAESGYTLTAPANGLVTEVKGKAGEEAPGGELVSLSADGAGSRITAAVTKDQAKWLAVGDEARVGLTLDGRRQSIAVRLSGIGLDTPGADGTERYRLTFTLPEGSYLSGESAEITLEKPSEQYYTTLPLTALRTENGASFVYVLREKSSVLGSEMTVDRVEVTVADQDEKTMAVEAALSGDDKVVTTSNRTLAQGDRVRTAESK